MRTTCFLCDEPLEPVEGTPFQKHPESETCLVRMTDSYGIALDEHLIPQRDEQAPPKHDFFEELENIRLFPFIEDAIREVFSEHGIARLGGVSTGYGWSAFSTFQRCRYLYLRRYIEPIQTVQILPALEPEARAVGTMIHTLLAIYYTRMIVPDYPLTPELMRDELLRRANPEIVNEGWRVFLSYSLYYQGENIMPLAVEYDLRDPRTNESCRFDLIAFFPEAQSDRQPGTYNVEHKSSSRFDDDTLNGWANDGEILGQMLLWDRMKLGLRFGPLKGTIVNILGKQKEPKFHRTTVAPETWQTKQHARDLKVSEAEIRVARATNHWPRSRANCIHRYGRCDLWDHCVTTED